MLINIFLPPPPSVVSCLYSALYSWREKQDVLNSSVLSMQENNTAASELRSLDAAVVQA